MSALGIGYAVFPLHLHVWKPVNKAQDHFLFKHTAISSLPCMHRYIFDHLLE